MPLYEFYDEELGESYEMMMTIANLSLIHI